MCFTIFDVSQEWVSIPVIMKMVTGVVACSIKTKLSLIKENHFPNVVFLRTTFYSGLRF